MFARTLSFQSLRANPNLGTKSIPGRGKETLDGFLRHLGLQSQLGASEIGQHDLVPLLHCNRQDLALLSTG